MSQPIPKKILKTNPELALKPFNTLLVDGSNLLEISLNGDKRLSSDGKPIGGVFQFLLQLKLMLRKANFEYVYVMWDFDRAGQLRVNELPTYKANRDKNFDDPTLSEYGRQFNEKCREMMRWAKEKQRKRYENNPDYMIQKGKEKEIFHYQREILMSCLEELFIRQCGCDEVEADDLIAYYILKRKPNERIVILSGDRDLTQLIDDNVIVYCPSPNVKDFITAKNHRQIIGYHHENVLLKKILCGDSSDNIKGIKGLGETTLFNNFPEIKERKVTLDEVIEKSRSMIAERVRNKKKPLKWCENIVNKVTDGVQGDRIYEINDKVINLRKPLLTDDAKQLMDSLIHYPLDPEGRTMDNLYSLICGYGIDELKDVDKFGNFFIEFKYLIDKEQKFFKSENKK